MPFLQLLGTQNGHTEEKLLGSSETFQEGSVGAAVPWSCVTILTLQKDFLDAAAGGPGR